MKTYGLSRYSGQMNPMGTHDCAQNEDDHDLEAGRWSFLSICATARLIFLDAFAGERLRVSFSMRFAALKEDQLTFTDPYDMGLSSNTHSFFIAATSSQSWCILYTYRYVFLMYVYMYVCSPFNTIVLFLVNM